MPATGLNHWRQESVLNKMKNDSFVNDDRINNISYFIHSSWEIEKNLALYMGTQCCFKLYCLVWGRLGFFWPHHVTCMWLLVPPRPLSVKAQSPKHRTAREFPQIVLLIFILQGLEFFSDISFIFYYKRQEKEIYILNCLGHFKAIVCFLIYLICLAPLRRRKWQPTPVFLLGELHGQRSLVGCCPWGRTELDMTAHSWT